MTRARLLSWVLILGALLHSTHGQTFSVGTMTFSPLCGLEDLASSWLYNFRMLMPAENNRHFKRQVRIHTVDETLCYIDLDSCQRLDNVSETSEMCWCARSSGANYDLNVKKLAALRMSEAPMSASIDWLHDCYPEDLTKLMTLLPPVYNARQPLTATITVDDGVTQPLSDTQVIAVCNDHYVDLTVCVHNLEQPYTVKLTCHELHETWVADTECIKITKRYNFLENSHYNLSLTYGEATWCPRHGEYTIMFEETPLECPPEPCDDVPEPETCERSTEGILPRYTAKLDEHTRVMCDSVTDGGGWFVILRRTSGVLDFYETYQKYKLGFGNVTGDHWIGLEVVHEHCFSTHSHNHEREQLPCELRVDMEFGGQAYYAHYSSFWLEGGAGFYTLHVSGYSGDAGDSLTYHDGSPFTTHDQDHDANGGNCAVHNHGGFWYHNCHNANPTGVWATSDYGNGVVWDTLTGMSNSLTFVEMKFRLPEEDHH